VAKGDPETLAKIHLYEEDWPAAIELARQKTNYETMQVLVADGVKEKHPEEAIQIYPDFRSSRSKDQSLLDSTITHLQRSALPEDLSVRW
jgi:hypothetical protein